MIVLDLSLILLAADAEHPLAARARSVLDELERGGRSFAVPSTALEFAAFLLDHKTQAATAGEQERLERRLKTLLEARGASVIAEGPRHWSFLKTILASNPEMDPGDARLAAICLEHGVDELWSIDGALSWLPSVRVRSPL